MSIVFLDTETTGLNPDSHAIWEVGLITPDGEERVWQFPIHETKADPFALNVGQYWDRRSREPSSVTERTAAIYDAHHPDNRVCWIPRSSQQAWAEYFRDLIGTSHLVGAIPSFDEERLRRWLFSMGVIHRWHYHVIDVEALMVGFINGKAQQAELGLDRGMDETSEWISPITLPWKSKELSLAVGVNPDDFEQHTALGDARWAKAVYKTIMGTTL